jgi:hypothetical protein
LIVFNKKIKIPAYLIFIVIIFIIISFALSIYNPNNNIIETEIDLKTKSSNPDGVISPVDNNPQNKQDKLIKNISIKNAVLIENIVLNWQNIFDIFVFNIQDSVNFKNDSLTFNYTLKHIINSPKRRLNKQSSDKILEDFGNIIVDECKHYDLDWRLILAIIKQESAFTFDAVSHAGAYGFMQIMPKTGSMLEQTLQLDDHRSPENNLKAGIYYYALLVGRYYGTGDTNKFKFALAAYNAGSGRVEDAMSMAYYFNEDYKNWDIVKEYLKLLSPENDSLHKIVWGNKPPNGYFSNWKEPYFYVENIMWYWQQYRKLYPLPEDNKKTKKKPKK